VPNATSFIVQRLLIHSDRPPRKRSQDILYIHDTLELLADRWATSAVCGPMKFAHVWRPGPPGEPRRSPRNCLPR
jgi:hypothetical protein